MTSNDVSSDVAYLKIPIKVRRKLRTVLIHVRVLLHKSGHVTGSDWKGQVGIGWVIVFVLVILRDGNGKVDTYLYKKVMN